VHARSLEIQVQQRTNELFEANATKDKVISLVSHDLRLPVARLKEMTQLIRRKLDHADVAELVSRGFADIESSLERTEELVQELLNTSNIDAGQFIVHREPANLVELCASCLDALAHQHSLHLTCDFVGLPLEAEVDQAQFSQVLRNLLAGAHEQMDWDDPVSVTIQQAGHEAIISIRNLDAQARPSMDLYVSRNIIERHGGHLEAQNFPGDHCTYFIILPLSAELERQQPDAAALLPRTHAAWSLRVPNHEGQPLTDASESSSAVPSAQDDHRRRHK
jgi:signal transduction histidine kinase